MKRIYLSGLILCILLSGCSNANLNDSSSVVSHGVTKEDAEIADMGVSNMVPFPDHYELHNGNVTFDCKVRSPETVSLYKTTAEPLRIDEDAIIEYYSVFDENVEYEEYETREGDTLKQYHENDDSLSITNSSCMYFDYSLSYGNSLRINDDYGNTCNGERFLTGNELDFSTISNVEDRFRKLLTAFVPELEDIEYVVYTCDMSALQEEYLEYLDEKHTDYPTSEGYYITARQQLQNIPVFVLVSGVLYFDSDDNSPMRMYYTENGVGELNISDLYRFEESDELWELMSFEDITEQLSNYYNMLITESTYEVYRATLYNYVLPDDQGNYAVTPVWIFKIRQVLPDGSCQMLQKEINAVTGEEFQR